MRGVKETKLQFSKPLWVIKICCNQNLCCCTVIFLSLYHTEVENYTKCSVKKKSCFILCFIWSVQCCQSFQHEPMALSNILFALGHVQKKKKRRICEPVPTDVAASCTTFKKEYRVLQSELTIWHCSWGSIKAILSWTRLAITLARAAALSASCLASDQMGV